MKAKSVVRALAALAQDSRLALFRLLVKRGPEGYSAGELSERLEIPAPTLSFHLKTLAHAGLIGARKESRFVFYSANFVHMGAIVGFLTEHCCSLATDCAPVECAPLVATRRRKSASNVP
jgi:ArsR family transcriptional regulator, arsenate/arsenite/antimonite-responsive transcriptional repressor